MAVIIENMKIPEGCEYCELAYATYYEDNEDGHALLYCSYTKDCVEGFYKERANNCPLRESIQRPQGEWIDYGNNKVGHSIRCSKCGEDFGNNQWLTEYFYCPSCGKRMEAEEGEVK